MTLLIRKERKIPLKIKKLESLIKRINPGHPSMSAIEAELARNMAGYRGEQSIDYYLKSLPSDEYIILHDIRLEYKRNVYFQLDTLLMTKKHFVILEVKNIAGTLFFDQLFQQLIRTKDDKEEAFSDPLIQVRQQELNLRTWLMQHKIEQVPIYSFVVISNPASILKTLPHNKEIFQKVIRSATLPEKLNKLNSSSCCEKLTEKEMRKITRIIIKKDAPSIPDYLKQFNINHLEIITGVHCPACSAIPMFWEWGNWKCANCNTVSKNAHLQALNDYYLLVDTTITNKNLRKFLHLPSISVSQKLLSSLNLTSSGSYRNRSHQLRIFEVIDKE